MLRRQDFDEVSNGRGRVSEVKNVPIALPMISQRRFEQGRKTYATRAMLAAGQAAIIALGSA